MKWIRALLAFALVALWLPAVNHCQLEQLDWVEAAQACCASPESNQNDPPEDCSIGCCPIEYAVCVSSTFRVPVPDHVLLSQPQALVASCFASDQNEAVLSEPSPPELIRQWQFLFRTALSPRAPSLIS